MSSVCAQPASEISRLDVPYGQNPKQRLDLYSPREGGGNRSAVIMIHGGGWGGGDKREYAYIGHLAATRGMVAAAINYRLADGSPEGLWPAQLDDVQAAVGWVRRNAAELGVNPRRLCALGASAGGHLAVFLAVLPKPDSAHVSCVVDEFGPVNLVNFLPGPAENLFGKTDPTALRQIMERASPINFVTKSTAPTLIVQGTADTKVKPEQSMALHTALLNAGVQTAYISFAGGHGFEGVPGPRYTALLEQELDFIAQNAPP